MMTVLRNIVIFSKKKKNWKTDILSLPKNKNGRACHHIIFLWNFYIKFSYYKIEVSAFATELEITNAGYAAYQLQ